MSSVSDSSQGAYQHPWQANPDHDGQTVCPYNAPSAPLRARTGILDISALKWQNRAYRASSAVWGHIIRGVEAEKSKDRRRITVHTEDGVQHYPVVHAERTSRLLQTLELARADGSYAQLLQKLARIRLLIFDDLLHFS